jgi:NADH-quinone oxidoreductase subunit J
VNIVIQIIFVLLTILILGAGLMVVIARNIIHAALWLIASFFGVAALYLLMQAEFLAVVQVLIYVGAISVLILFAIMLTRSIAAPATGRHYERWWLALLIAGSLFAIIITPTVLNHEWYRLPPTEAAAPTAPDAAAPDTAVPQVAGPVEIGMAFMQEYMIPFQVAAILLLVALTGAIVIAFEERSRRQRVLTWSEELALQQQQQQESSGER